MICPTCNGTGRITHPALKGEWCCPTCEGKGVIVNKVKKTPWKGISIEVRR